MDATIGMSLNFVTIWFSFLTATAAASPLLTFNDGSDTFSGLKSKSKMLFSHFKVLLEKTFSKII